MTTILLRGILGKRYGKQFTLNVSGVRRAVDALDRLKPGLRREILRVNGAFQVKRNDRILREEHLDFPTNGDTVTITPLYGGAASKALGIGQAVLGVVLIVLGAFTSVFGGAGIPVALLGASLLLGGVASLLSPIPNLNSEDPKAKKASYQFSSPVNTVAQGSPVPVCLGRMVCGSAVASEGLNALDIIDSGDGGGTNGGSNNGEGTAGTPIFRARPY